MDISANRAYTIPRVVFGEGYAIHQACGEPFVLGVRDDGVGGHGVGVLGFGLHGSTGGGAGLGDGGGDAEAGLPLPFDSGLTFAVDREKAPHRLTLRVEGTSAQPLLLNGYAVSGEGEDETLTLCASCQLPFQEAVTLDFSEELGNGGSAGSRG